MKRRYYFTLILAACLMTASSHAQILPSACPTPPPPPTGFCELSCVYCNIDGYSGVNATANPTSDVYCGTIQIHNPDWFGFIAGTPEITFEISNSNCTTGDGLQVAILEDCAQDAIACNPGAAASAGVPLTLSYSEFVPGKTYYLMIDGWVADVCNYTIQVVSGSTQSPIVGIPAIPEGPNHANCTGDPETYSIPPVSGAGYYHWTAPPGASINGQSNNVILPAPGGSSVQITMGPVSGQVCVAVGNACTAQGNSKCIFVSANTSVTQTLPLLTIPFTDLPYHWPQDPAITLTNSGTFNLMATLTSWQGCDSIVIQNVIVLPPSQGYVTGTIYWDTNNNGVKDAGELPYTAGAVVKAASGQLTNSGADGNYSFNNLPLGDTIRAIAPLPGIVVNPAFRKIQNGVWTAYDFGLLPISTGFDVRISLSATILRPGFSTWMTVTCENIGTDLAGNVSATVSIPAALEYLIATLAPASFSGHDITWNLGDLPPGTTRSFQIQVRTPLGTALGTAYTFGAAAKPLENDVNPANNFYTLKSTVLGSFDPNDKTVEPAYVTPALLASGQPFEYTIRFQNTGNHPAEFVRIVDTLGSMVDPASFRFQASSHPCTWKMRGTGVVEFLFEHIQLPDSSANEAGSHGFVQFTVKPKSNLTLGSVVQNFCDIYFDYNTPVRTNTAGTQVVYFIPGTGLAAQDALKLRPNPATTHALCDWNTPAPADGRIRLFDLRGLPRMEVPVQEGLNFTHLDVRALTPGVYFVLLEAGSLVLTNKLVVVPITPIGWN